jgi:hypothetical protein
VSHRLAELKSLALHREVARRLRADPTALDRARARVAGWGEEVHPYYRERWAEALAGDVDSVCALLEADSELARDLRQASPFAGVLEDAARWAVLRAVEEAWTASRSST